MESNCDQSDETSDDDNDTSDDVSDNVSGNVPDDVQYTDSDSDASARIAHLRLQNFVGPPLSMLPVDLINSLIILGPLLCCRKVPRLTITSACYFQNH